MSKTGSQSKRSAGILVTLVVISGLLSYFITGLPPLRTIELKWIDMMFEYRGPLQSFESPIVLVAISEQADYELPEKFPWPTSYYAKLIDNLNAAGAAVIGIDVIFDKYDIYDPLNDTLFSEALKKHGNVILAGNVMREVQRATNVEVRSTFDAQQLVQPNHLLINANPNRWGFVYVNRDMDGFLRRYPLETFHFDEKYQSFGLEIAKIYLGLTDKDTGFTETGYVLGDIQIPRWDSQHYYINYAGPPSSFPEYNFSDIIDTQDFNTVSEDEEFQINAFDDPDFGLLYQDIFRDKIVIVGSTLPELHDFYPTPFAPNGFMPGYESHANAVNTILSGQFITRPDNLTTFVLIAIFALIIITITYLSPLWIAIVFLSVTILGYLYTLFWMFTNQNLIVEMVGPTFSLMISFVVAVVFNYVNEQKQKTRIKNMFGSYVSPELVERMVNSGEVPGLGGEKARITAFFSDIRGFSLISEKLQPEDLVELLNEYLGGMTDILIEEEGTLDKYIGDAIVAFFGAPVHYNDHAHRACVTAHKIQKKQSQLREKWQNEGDKWPKIVWEMQTRIGINTGDVITGNMGSTKRFNYTMMGDDVNLAARCESGAKSYGVFTMVTGQTRSESEEISDSCVFRALDRIVVKGRTKPVDVHELVGFRNELTDSDFQCIDTFERGLQAYFSQNWVEAIILFSESAKFEKFQPGGLLNIPTNPSLVMLNRIEQLQMEELPADWDGVYIMKTK